MTPVACFVYRIHLIQIMLCTNLYSRSSFASVGYVFEYKNVRTTTELDLALLFLILLRK